MNTKTVFKRVLIAVSIIIAIGSFGLTNLTSAQVYPNPANFRLPVVGTITENTRLDTCLGHSGSKNLGRHFVDINTASSSFDRGEPIYSSSDGDVVFTGWDTTGYGNTVIVRDYVSGVAFLYAHLARIHASVGHINKGDLIGYMGNTGRSFGAHLHWEAWPLNPIYAFDLLDVEGLRVDMDIDNPCNAGGFTASNHHTNPYNTCAEVAAANISRPAIFSDLDCTGAMHILDGDLPATGHYVNTYIMTPAWNDRIRSIYIPTHLQSISMYVSAHADSIAHPGLCLTQTATNLDLLTYSGVQTKVGWVPSDADLRSDNMVSAIAALNNSNCTIFNLPFETYFPNPGMVFEDIATNSAAIGGYNSVLGDGSLYPIWLQTLDRRNKSTTEIEISTEVLDTPEYNRHRVMLDGRVLYETYDSSFTHVEDINNISIGDHTLRVEYSLTSAGLSWDGAQFYEESFYLADILPPTTTATLTGLAGNNGWYRGPVTVNMSATDNVGVAHTYYQINGGEFTEGTSFTLTTDAIYSISFYSVDTNANTEEVQTIEIKLDQTPPQTTGTATGPRDINGIFRDSVAINLTPTDNLSGIDFTECSSDNQATWSVSALQFLIEGNGVHQFYCRAQDIAGNVEPDPLNSGPIIINTYIIFSASPANGFLMDANTSVTIIGDAYSEGPVQISRNTNVSLTGALEIVSGSYTFATSNVNTTIGNVLTNVGHVNRLSYPLSFYWNRCDQVHPNGLRLDTVGQTMTGVICVQGNLEMYVVNITGDVTFVVNGHILMDPTISSFTNNDPSNGVVLYATGDIMLRGTATQFLGLMYANGTIFVESTGMMHMGSYVGDRVIFDGATNLNISYSAAFAPTTVALPVTNASFADPQGYQVGPTLGLLPARPWEDEPVPTFTLEPTATPTAIPPTSTFTATPNLVEINVAYQKAVTVDSVHSTYIGAFAVDGLTDNPYRWLSANTNGPHWADINLGGTYQLNRAVIKSGWFNGTTTQDPIPTFVLQWSDGVNWYDIPGSFLTGNTNTDLSLTFTTPVVANRIRFWSPVNGHVRLKELEVYGWAVTSAPTSTFTPTFTPQPPTLTSTPTQTAAGPAIGTGTGLTGSYFQDTNLSQWVFDRLDSQVNFNWGGGSPDPSLDADTFSVRWTGFIQPLYTESLVFCTRSDDGIRVWVNAVQIINNWTDHGNTRDCGSALLLTAGQQYPITIEYYDNVVDARAELYWSSPSIGEVLVPQSQLYPAITLTATPTAVQSATLTPTLTPTMTDTPLPTLTFTPLPTDTPLPTPTLTWTTLPPFDGGRIQNGSFEASGSLPAQGWNTNGALSIDTTLKGNHGNNSLHFSPSGGYTNAVSWGFGGISPSASYTWSLYVNATGNGTFGFIIDEYDANWALISGQSNFPSITTTGSGMVVMNYIPSSAAVVNVSVQMYLLSGGTLDVYVDSVRFVQN